MFHRKNWYIAFFSILLIFIFVVGIFIGRNFLPPGKLQLGAQIPSQYLAPFNDAWKIVHNQYLNQPVKDDHLMQGAIRGMIDSLEDPFSSYMNPDEYKTQSNLLEGEYTGIGAWVDTSGDFLVIISPMPGSPAEAAGIMPGDVVIGIDGQDVTGLDPSLVLNKILGPAGTTIAIKIRRDNQTLEFTLKRAVITVPSVETRLLNEEIGYIRLYTFGANSAEEVRTGYEKIKAEGASKLIFDLRNNSGGFLDAAVEITSLFLEDGVILIEEWGDGSRKLYNHTGKTLDADSPMVILINEGTASASEIMAGALQDYKRATLIGAPSFGKGYIQNWMPLQNDFGAIRITVARWLTPKGRQIQGEGLTPDIFVIHTDEDFKTQNDRQIQRAVEYLSAIKN